MLGRRIAAVLATSTLVTIAGSGAASAATVTERDPVGDAAARFDIVRVTYTNNDEAFGYRMKLRDITRKNGTFIFPKLLVNGTWDRFFAVTSGARRDGTRFHRLDFFDRDTHQRIRCAGMTGRVDFATDVVRARVPQACLDRVGFGHRRYKTVGYAATPGMAEAGDETRFRWVNFD